MTVNQLKRKDEDYKDWRWKWYSFDFYKQPEDFYNWKPCPDCGLRPKIWVFDNGRRAHCVCGHDRYHHTREVSATSIGEIVRKTGGFVGYDEDELRRNWNKTLTKTEQAEADAAAQRRAEEEERRHQEYLEREAQKTPEQKVEEASTDMGEAALGVAGVAAGAYIFGKILDSI